MKKALSVFIIILFLDSCKHEIANVPTEIQKMAEETMVQTKKSSTLVVISAPSVNNGYYRHAGAFQSLISFDISYARAIMQGTDKVVVLADKATLPYLSVLPDSVLLESGVQDIWIRDFGTFKPGVEAKFTYHPEYLSSLTAKLIDNSFNSFAKSVGLKYGGKTNIVLDGGNFVDNGSDKVIITDRIFKDNPNKTQAQLTSQIKSLTGVSSIAYIQAESGDTTGHADGEVMWLAPNKIGLSQMNYDTTDYRQRVIAILQSSFPGVAIVDVPDNWDGQYYGGFASACGLYVNCTVTDNYIYMPTFNSGDDATAHAIIQNNTSKKVVDVPAQDVCFLGGSVRCLSMQVLGNNAANIIAAAKVK